MVVPVSVISYQLYEFSFHFKCDVMRAVEEILERIQMINDVISVKPRTTVCIYLKRQKCYQVFSCILFQAELSLSAQ